MDRQPVDLVRVPKEEKYYDREEVLGRDMSSVFPTESRKVNTASSALAELLGPNKKFISETELEDIKSQRGLRAEDGTIAADKPLMEILREAKEAKDEAFKDQWKQMKQGKNRPLDDDEMEFIDNIAEAEAATRRRHRQEEEDELSAFHAAQRAQQGTAGSAGEGPSTGGILLGPELEEEQLPRAGTAPAAAAAATARQQAAGSAKPAAAAAKKLPLVSIKPIARAVVRVKGAAAAAAGSSGGTGGGPALKRQRTEEAQEEEAGSGSGSEGPGLAGLLGGYGSDSDS